MSAAGAKEMIARELQAAMERLHKDIARVEFWADALGGFAKPIPDYEESGSRLNQFILPQADNDAKLSSGPRSDKRAAK